MDVLTRYLCSMGRSRVMHSVVGIWDWNYAGKFCCGAMVAKKDVKLVKGWKISPRVEGPEVGEVGISFGE